MSAIAATPAAADDSARRGLAACARSSSMASAPSRSGLRTRVFRISFSSSTTRLWARPRRSWAGRSPLRSSSTPSPIRSSASFRQSAHALGTAAPLHVRVGASRHDCLFSFVEPAALATSRAVCVARWIIIVVRTFISMYEIPSSALVAELTPDYDQRTSVLRLALSLRLARRIGNDNARLRRVLRADETLSRGAAPIRTAISDIPSPPAR